MPNLVQCQNISKLVSSIFFFDFVIYVLQRHLLCRSALCQVGAVVRVETFWPLVVGFDSAIYGMTVIVGLEARILCGLYYCILT